MNYLYAPWRTDYSSENKPDNNNACPFCLTTPADDEKNLIIKRFEYWYLLLNKFPYNPGHLLLIPYQHKASLELLTEKERLESSEILAYTLTILKKALKNHGTNIGLNLGGKAAGGSVPEHLHWHIVPRFFGDTNFLTTLAETKIIAHDLLQMYYKLKEAF
jgi:ATP adenylyltransferase